MPKMKTHSGSKKRFSKKGKKIKLSKGFKRHLLTKKTTKRKRQLRKGGYVSKADTARLLKLLPN